MDGGGASGSQGPGASGKDWICGACGKNDFNPKDKWILCKRCDSWYHYECARVTRATEDYTCLFCTKKKKCAVCGRGDESWIKCGTCEKWYHKACLDVPVAHACDYKCDSCKA